MFRDLMSRVFLFFIGGNISEGQLSINLVNLGIAGAFMLIGFLIGLLL